MKVAKFTYSFQYHTVLYLEDLKDSSLPTLTNSIEQALSIIEKKEKINWRDYLVIQKDSEDMFCQIFFDKNSNPLLGSIRWKFLSKDSLEDAIKKMIS